MNSHLLKLASAVALAVVAFTAGSEAASRSRSGRSQTGRGRTGTVEQSTTRTRDSMHRERTVTDDNGRTATQTVDRTHDREAGTGTINRSATGHGRKHRTVTHVNGAQHTGSVTVTGNQPAPGN